MSSRLISNRANSKQSTGPRTEPGKDRAKYNATLHGLTGKQVVIYGEDPAQFEALRSDLLDAYQPANAAESTLVEEIAQNFWRLQRARRIETETFNINSGGADPVITFGCAADRFDQLRRYMTTIERAYHRAIAQLEKTQALRRKQPLEPGPVGFVSQSPATPTVHVPSARATEAFDRPVGDAPAPSPASGGRNPIDIASYNQS
jgi:hypothetical protein